MDCKRLSVSGILSLNFRIMNVSYCSLTSTSKLKSLLLPPPHASSSTSSSRFLLCFLLLYRCSTTTVGLPTRITFSCATTCRTFPSFKVVFCHVGRLGLTLVSANGQTRRKWNHSPEILRDSGIAPEDTLEDRSLRRVCAIVSANTLDDGSDRQRHSGLHR